MRIEGYVFVPRKPRRDTQLGDLLLLRREPGVDVLAYEHVPRNDTHIPKTLKQVIAARQAAAITRAVNDKGRSSGQRAVLQKALLVGWQNNVDGVHTTTSKLVKCIGHQQ